MPVYLDASILVALLGHEASSPGVYAWLEESEDDLLVSDFARAESSAALARQRRIGALSAAEAEEAFARLDAWTAQYTEIVEIASADLARSNQWVRRVDLALRAPDAIHVAAAQRLNAVLATLDRGQAASARTLNIPCINPADLPA